MALSGRKTGGSEEPSPTGKADDLHLAMMCLEWLTLYLAALRMGGLRRIQWWRMLLPRAEE
jgi:hypothetical protein